MENLHDTNYIVYVRQDSQHARHLGSGERPLKVCSSYAEARELQRQYLRAHQQVIIRYEGVSGGGD